MQIWCRCLLYVETVTSSRKYWLINAILFGSKLPCRTRNLLNFVQMEIIDLDSLCTDYSTSLRFRNFD